MLVCNMLTLTGRARLLPTLFRSVVAICISFLSKRLGPLEKTDKTALPPVYKPI